MLGTTYADVANDGAPKEASIDPVDDNSDPPNLVEVNDNDDAAQAALSEAGTINEEAAGCDVVVMVDMMGFLSRQMRLVLDPIRADNFPDAILLL